MNIRWINQIKKKRKNGTHLDQNLVRKKVIGIVEEIKGEIEMLKGRVQTEILKDKVRTEIKTEPEMKITGIKIKEMKISETRIIEMRNGETKEGQ